jgi:uncharacterized protein
MIDSPVINNESASQFELTADGEVAVLAYQLAQRAIIFDHTGVPKKLEGRGIAKKLAAAGLEFAREKGLMVVPQCSFIADYIMRHPEYLDLVHEDYRARLNR